VVGKCFGVAVVGREVEYVAVDNKRATIHSSEDRAVVAIEHE